MTRRNRIVKPRTAKQREHSRRFSQSRASQLVIQPKDTGLPDSSWWTVAPPDGFTTIAEDHSRRMRLSQFGSIRNPMFGDEA